MTRKRSSEVAGRAPGGKIREFMSSYLETIAAHDSVQHAAGRMRAFDLGCLLVRDDQELVGMITDRDITVRVTAAGKNPRTTAVSEVMSPGLICCNEDQDVEEVARMMEINQLHRLALIDREGHPTGIISIGDLARNGFEDLAARVLIAISQSVPAISGSPWLR
ncbi:MAG TPA: CBS domain-containing protein [Planctomycetota bacterium]|jgi:CBS domain-containing protein|nr:CBS domain-containing protein [Planctomycetota bacterium]